MSWLSRARLRVRASAGSLRPCSTALLGRVCVWGPAKTQRPAGAPSALPDSSKAQHLRYLAGLTLLPQLQQGPCSRLSGAEPAVTARLTIAGRDNPEYACVLQEPGNLLVGRVVARATQGHAHHVGVGLRGEAGGRACLWMAAGSAASRPWAPLCPNQSRRVLLPVYNRHAADRLTAR